MNLYEITSKYMDVLTNLQIDEETGEVINAHEIDDALRDFDGAMEPAACAYKNYLAEAEAMKREEEALRKRRQTQERRAEAIKNAMYNAMVVTGRDKYTSSKVSVNVRKNPISVLITPGTVLPGEYIKTKVIEEPDKKALKVAIENGANIEGVTLEQKLRLDIK